MFNKRYYHQRAVFLKVSRRACDTLHQQLCRLGRYSSMLANRFSIGTWRDEASSSVKSFATRNIVAWRWIFIFCWKFHAELCSISCLDTGRRSYYAVFLFVRDKVYRIITQMGHEISVEDAAKTHPVIAHRVCYFIIMTSFANYCLYYYCFLPCYNCQLLLTLK